MRVSATTARRAALCAFIAATFGGLAAPASAQNLLANAAFDGALTGWSDYGSGTPADGSRTFSAFPEDVGGVAGSGSAQLSLADAAGSGVQIGLAQCVPVAAGQTYNYGARVKQPAAGQTATGVAVFVDVAFYSDGACATSLSLGEEQGFAFNFAYPLSDTLWRAVPGTVPTSASVVVSPAGAASAQYRVLIERLAGNGTATVRVDNPFFGANLTPVQLQTYTVD